MKIPQQFAKIALQNADEARKAQGIEFDALAMNAFRTGLQEMARTGQYTEGAKLQDEHWKNIIRHCERLIAGAVNTLQDQSLARQRNVNAKDYVQAASNYLLAVAANELNCPDLPIIKDEWREKLGAWIHDVVKAKPNADIDLAYTYNNQRGINAKGLVQQTQYLINNATHDGKPNYNTLGELYAEYHALSQRQANHGAVWRFFHSKENAARNNLLKNMEKCLEKHGGLPSLENPNAAAEYIKDVERKSSNSMINLDTVMFDTNPAKVLGYEKYEQNPDLLRSEPQEDLSQQLANSLREDAPVVSQPVKDNPVKSAPDKQLN
jgi:hypothetical protein